ncbi:transketolase [Alphaproteobacteria bacterium]|nr:transketolase [Alphaproteobacteria bacterium]
MDNDLQKRVDWVWHETLKIHRHAPETRIASSLSPIEMFVSLFYGGALKHFPADPRNDDRDRLIISKGHGSICLYPILADLGFFEPEELNRVCQKGGILGAIPDPIIPGYETVNGSLGHGLGVATGVALGLKSRGKDNSVFVLSGDGELHEGACWEAIMFAGHHGLDNMNLLIDNNSISMLGFTDDIISHGSLASRLNSFGWDTVEIDGHNIHQVHETISTRKTQKNGKPKAMIARTLKGRGVPGLENQPLCHIINPKPETLDTILDDHHE